ncbi:MAG: hypothetical protein KGZ40_03595 [Clostridiales bacterium]|nr:hypothetical protein [Clostridiales bacterium]
MSFEELLRRRTVERVTVTSREIAELLALSKRDIKAAGAMLGTDLDWAFAIAYNGVLQMSIAYMNHLGYRPRGEGKHYNTFRFMEEALPEDAQMIRRLQKLRRKRNTTIYEQSGLVSDKEARDVISFASRYYASIEAKLPRDITGQVPKEDA